MSRRFPSLLTIAVMAVVALSFGANAALAQRSGHGGGGRAGFSSGDFRGGARTGGHGGLRNDFRRDAFRGDFRDRFGGGTFRGEFREGFRGAFFPGAFYFGPGQGFYGYRPWYPYSWFGY
jgi:hypothetical protein